MVGYELFRKVHDIKNEKGKDTKDDGVLLYVKNELNSTDRGDFENSSFKECKWVTGLTYMLGIKNIGWCLL